MRGSSRLSEKSTRHPTVTNGQHTCHRSDDIFVSQSLGRGPATWHIKVANYLDNPTLPVEKAREVKQIGRMQEKRQAPHCWDALRQSATREGHLTLDSVYLRARGVLFGSQLAFNLTLRHWEALSSSNSREVEES
jgi:hypothetical protein